MSHSILGDIPPGLYIVSYYHDDGMRAELPACGLGMALSEANDRAKRFGVMVDIDGIGPEKSFHRTICAMPEVIAKLLYERS